MFVLDASVALAWLIDTSVAPYALRIRGLLENGDLALVPPIWQLEIANGFVVAERRRVLTAVDTAEILRRFEMALAGSIEIRDVRSSTQQIITTARQFHLTAYDATYLALAIHEQLPIATLDRALAEAAKQAGLKVL